jgi:PKD repeat protein
LKSLADSDKAAVTRWTGAIAALVIAVGAALLGGSVTIFGPRTLVRTEGPPNVFTFTVSPSGTTAPYLLHIDNHGITSAVVTLNGAQILGPSDFKATKSDDWKKPADWDDNDWEPANGSRGDSKDGDWRKDHDWKGEIERTVTLRSTNTLRVELRSKPGSHLSIRVTGGDAVPPTITAAAMPAANAAGWNRTDVQVTFTCAAGGSPIATCTPPVLVTTAGRGQVISGRAVDSSGGSATASVTLNIDKTPPAINGGVQPPPNEFGWVNKDATVSFACTDALSGVASCSGPVVVATEGGNQSAGGTAADIAGNTASASVTVSLDKTLPAITAALSPEPNTQGWNRGDVTVTFSCADGDSGIASCPAPVTVSTEGAGQKINGTARDRAGNTASASVTLNIDKTVPVISVSPLPAANANGWNNSDVTVSFTCSDDGAGVALCPGPVTVAAEGAQQVISREVTDNAGHSATATAVISIDKTAPTITATALPPPNASGWNDTNVTVTFACADSLSGIATCQPPVTPPEGAGQSVAGTAVDQAGNSATTAITLNLDKTPVSIRGEVQPPPNEAGWSHTNVTVTFVCEDTGSGVGNCPPPIPVTLEGTGQVISGTGSDRAGNQSTASVTVNLDKTPPQIATDVTPAPNASGWINRTASVRFICADAGGSGIASCPPPVTAGEGGGQQIAGTAVDVAGNSATAGALVSVDLTPPTIVASVSPLPSADGWITQDATVTFSCSDSGSGVATCPAARTITSEGANQVVSATAVDRADNTAVASVTLNILKTPLSIAATVDPPANAAGWNRSNVLVTFTCAGSGGSACPAPVTVTTEGEGQVVTRRITNAAGLFADASVTLNIDKSAPSISAVAMPALNIAGWSRADVTVSFTCGDGVSGIVSCPAPTTVSTETAGTTVSGAAVDKAGNSSAASALVKIDKTPPSVAISSPAPGAMLLSSPAALAGIVSDALSGIVSATCNGAPASVGPGGALGCGPALIPGGNSLTLAATDAAGNTSTSDVSVTYSLNHPPTADAGLGQSGIVGTPLPFSGAGSQDPDNDPLSYAWAFGDGGSASGISASHAYTSAGTYAVTLTVTDSKGASAGATTSATIVAANRPPTASAGANYSGIVGTPINFAGSASDPDNDPLVSTWSFGDGSFASGTAASHAYDAAGSYTLTLTISDGQLSTSASATVQVAGINHRPVVGMAAGQYSGTTGMAVIFSATASDADNDPLTMTWNFGDGGTGAGSSASHTFASAGTFTVTVTVSDTHGEAATATAGAAIAQANRPPRASANGPYSGQARNRITLSAAGTTDADNDALTYSWDFGDGMSGSGVAPNHAYASAGGYAAKVTVDDNHGGRDSATAAVQVSPPAAIVNQPPIARPGGPYAGQSGVVLSLNGSASTDPDNDALSFSWNFGDGTTGSGPAPAHVYAIDGSFQVTLTVDDAHGHSTTAVTSASLAPASDRAPPSVSLTAPSRVLPGTTATITATATDNVGVASVTFDVDGSVTTLTAPPFQRIVNVPAVAAPGAQIVVRADAADAAGNVGTAQMALTIDAAPDTENPVVVLNAPADATPGSTIRLTATATDNVGVRSVAFTAEGSPLATVPAPPYESVYTVPADAVPGSILSFGARAVDFTGNRADRTATVSIASQTDTTAPAVNVAAPAGVPPGASLTIAATATDAGGVADVALYVDGVEIARVAQAPYGATYRVPTGAAPGSILHVEARANDFSGNEGSATAETAVVIAGSGLAIGEVYDDTTGLLLPGATVSLVGVDASGAPYTQATQTDGRGRFLIRAAAGQGVLTITGAGLTRVDRPVALRNGMVVEVLDSRLMLLGTPAPPVSGVLGGSVSINGNVLTVAAGTGIGSTPFALTAVSVRGLGGPLPLGWSPVSVLDVTPHGTAIAGSTFAVPNALHLPAGTPLVLARWDEAQSAWRAVGDASVSADASALQGSVDVTAQFSILLADTQPSAPAHPNAGELLGGVTAVPLPLDAMSLVTAQPKVIFYSPGVKSDVTGLLTSSAPIPSGTVIWSRITESYQFFSGAEIHPDPYTADIVFYQVANEAIRQGATYIVSPSLTFEPLSLESGVITVSLFVPSATPPPIATVSSSGATLTAATGESIEVPPGAATDALPLQISGLSAAEVGALMPDGVDFIGALRLDFSGTLALPATASVPMPPSLTDSTGILLVRLQELEGQTRLVLVAVGRVAGDRVVSDVSLGNIADAFEGVRVAGRYAFVRMQALTAFAAGTVFGAGNTPFAGALVSTPTVPVVSLSRGAAGYIAVGAVGAASFTAKDIQRSDVATASLTFIGQNEVRPLDLHLVAQPPTVASFVPSEGSTSVALATAVVVTFSKPIDPATLAGASAGNIMLATDDGTIVPATLGLSARNSVATLRPAAPLQPNTVYTVTVAPAIADASGNHLGAAASARFTSLDTVPPLPPPAGAVTATIPVNGASTVTGTQGTGGAHDQVSIVNLVTGQITPVLINPNGGFSTTIAASARDTLRLKIVDPAGNQTTLDLPRFSQSNADGSVSTAVGTEGGHITGPGDTAVDISPGTFPDGAVITIKPVSESEFPVHLTAEQKTVLAYAGGVRLDFGGATPTKYVNVSVPAGPNDKPDDQWVVSAATEVNGQMVMNVVDTAKLTGGRIETSSPPCPGVTGAAVYGIHKSLRPFGLNYGQMYATGYGGLEMHVNLMPVGAFVLLPFMSFTPSFPTPVCLPVLAGSVSVGLNAQRVTIPANQLAPADREIIITSEDGEGQAADSHFPKSSVRYSFEMAGKDTDSFTVVALAAAGTPGVPVPNVRITRSTPSSVLVSFSPDVLTAPGLTKIVINNTTKSTQAMFPQQQIAYAVSVPGGAGSVSRVRVIDAGGAVRDISNFTTSSPNGPERLVVHAVRGTIDPTWDQLDELPPDQVPFGARGVVDVTVNEYGPSGSQIVHVPPSERVDGSFSVGLNGVLSDTFVVSQTYADRNGANPSTDSINIPTFHVTVTNPLSGEVLRSFVIRVPGINDLINLGSITDDKQSPYLVASPPQPQNFDPGTPLSFTFSEPMNGSSIQLNLSVKANGSAVSGRWQMSAGDRVATFIPDAPLHIGETYTVTFNGMDPTAPPPTSTNPSWITDVAGNAIAKRVVTIKTFLPHLVKHFRVDDDDFTFAASPRDMGFRDVAIQRKRLANGTLSTTLVAVTGSDHGSKVMTINATDPAAPAVVGRAGGSNTKQRVTLVPDIGIGGAPALTLREPAGCNPASASGTFTGDMAVTTSFNSYFSIISFFDVTPNRPMAPCLLANKILTVEPGLVTGLSQRGTVKAPGYARAVGIVSTTKGFEAYVAVGQVGAMAVDVAGNIPEVLPADRKLEGLYSADYRDLAMFNDRIVAGDQSGNRLDLLDANLALLSSLGLGGGPRRVTVAAGFGADENDDGSITQSEIHDLAVVGEDVPGGDSLIEFVDISDVRALQSLGTMPIPGLVRDIKVDVERRRAFVATYSNSGNKLYVVDMNHLGRAGILWSVPVPSAQYGLTLDTERGLLYDSTDAGIDIWAVYDNCCDLAVDMAPKPTPDPMGDRDALVRREKAALQKGIAAGLAAAEVSCVNEGGITGITILEQGSGACLWQPDPLNPRPNEPKTACGRNPNYQPGLSDHDFEVFLPAAVNSCVSKKLTDQFKDRGTGDRKPIEVGGSKMVFDDISFFPVSRVAFKSGKLDLTPPPVDSDDPNGDFGLGRQQLLLKWLLEGEYIDVPGLTPGDDLNGILKLVQVSALEGYEWSILQENAFASSKAFVRIRGAADPGMSLHKLFVKQLHSAGKAAIRAALARMVADDRARQRILTGLDRASYRRDGCLAVNPLSNDPDTWETAPCGSFEEWVASSAALTVRGARLPLFSVPDVQQIHRFYRVKADREHIVDENVADKFLLGAAKFIDTAKATTKAAFDAATMGPGAVQDAATRLANVVRVVRSTNNTRTETKIPLTPHVSNRGFIGAQEVEVALWTDVTAGTGTKGPAKMRDTLAGGDDHWLDYKRAADGKLILDSAGKPQPIFVLGPINTLTDTTTHGVAFTIDLEEHKVKEAYRQNNFGGFYYYVLGNTPGPGFSPPAPLPADKVAPDQACYDAPLVEITQAILVNGVPQRDLATVGFGANVTIRITVRNLSAVTQTGIKVQSSFTNQEYGFPDLLPTQEAHIDIRYKAPVGQSIVLDGTATVNSDSLGVLTSAPTRIVSVPSLYAVVAAEKLVNPDCLPAVADCKAPSQIMQGGRAFRHFRVINTMTLDKVPNAEVITKTTGPGVSGQLDTFTTDADGLVGTPTEPGMPIAYTPTMEGDYTVMPVSVNGSPMTAPDLKPLYIVSSMPLEYTQGLKAGVSMKIGGKILGGKGTLGAGGGLSFGLTVEKKPTPIFKKLTIGRSVNAKASLAFEPDVAKFDVAAGFSFHAEGPSAGVSIGVGVQIGDKYLFPTFPLTGEDRLRLAGLAIDTATRAETIGLPGGPIFSHILGAINNKVTSFEDRKTSDSATLSITGAIGVTAFKLCGGFGANSATDIQGCDKYKQDYRASLSLDAAGSVTGTIGAERLVQANQLVASAGISGETSVTAGLTIGRTREATNATSTGNFQELEFVKKEIEGLLQFSGGSSDGLDYSVTLDAAHSYNPIKLEIGFSGKKNFGWNFGPASLVANLGNGDQFTRTYTVTDPDTILPMLSTTANLAMLLPQGFTGVVLDPAGSFGFTPTNMYDQFVDLIALLGRNSTYSESIEKGNGISLPIGFDVSLLGEGAKAGVEVSADHSLSFTLASGVLKNHKHYKLEDYPATLLTLNGASDVLSMYAAALSSTSNTSDSFRAVQKTPPTGGSGSIKSAGSAELKPANQTDYEAVTGLLSFDFTPVAGPVRTRPYRPADVFGPADKPHYGLGGFHQFVPFDLPLSTPAPLILDYHDDELIPGVDENTIALYEWNKDRSDWDPVPATRNTATNTVQTTITKLGLFTLGPAMPAGDISWSVDSTTDLNPNTPEARRHVVFVSSPVAMNNGSSTPAGTMYHVISTSAAASMQNYSYVGTVTTPDLRPDLDGAQIAVGADGRLRIEVDYPAGIRSIQLMTFSDTGTAYGSPVLQVGQQ